MKCINSSIFSFNCGFSLNCLYHISNMKKGINNIYHNKEKKKKMYLNVINIKY